LAKSRNLIGLDIGSSSVKLVGLKSKKDRLILQHLDMAQLAPETIVEGAIIDRADLINTIQLLVSLHHLKKKKVAISISGTSVIVKKLTTVYMTDKEFEENLEWEVERILPFDLSEVNVDYQIIHRDEEKNQLEALVAAVKKETMEEYLNVVSETGLVVRVLDVDALAVGNAFFCRRESKDSETVVLANLGASMINLSITKSGIPKFMRDVALGGEQFTKEIQKRIGVTFKEAEQLKIGEKKPDESQELMIQDVLKIARESITSEIIKSINLYRSTIEDAPINRIVISGGTSLMEGLDRHLHDTLNIPVSVLNPFENVEIHGKSIDNDLLNDSAPMFAVAFGLALRQDKEDK